jgi:UDP-N-acetylmuramyl pentapeptide phosphotransferase/UDP-N-acetylglucosamine-1-phosphate transferase
MWLFVLIAFLTSAWLVRLTIFMADRHQLGRDESHGVQKFHYHPVPRLGGVPIFISILTSLLFLAWAHPEVVSLTTAFVVCLLPAFGIGLIEDITRKAGVLSRLLMTMVAAVMAWWLLEARLFRLDIPLMDTFLQATPVAALLLTLFSAGGVAHAVNIIDGYNGLSGFFVSVVFTSLGVIALEVGDIFIMQTAFVCAGAVFGFLVWNFPLGRIFMGDAGAYLCGFMLAELSILLVARNPEVSPWCPMLLMMYPVWETLFSMIRRSQISLKQMGQPDALHLHQLIYRRVVKRYLGSGNPQHKILRNSFTSIYLWFLALFCAVPAVAFWNQSLWLGLFCLLFIGTYVAIYRRLVRFRVPRFMVLKPRFLPQNRELVGYPEELPGHEVDEDFSEASVEEGALLLSSGQFEITAGFVLQPTVLQEKISQEQPKARDTASDASSPPTSR